MPDLDQIEALAEDRAALCDNGLGPVGLNQMNDLQARIRSVLLREWDPIGISDVPQAQDEYDAYLGELVRSVLEQRSASEIADRLVEIETDRMGLAGDRIRAVRVAERLQRLRPPV